MLFRATAEARRKLDSDQLCFGLSLAADPVNEDWLGAVYVMADSEEEAAAKIEAFFKEHAVSWLVDPGFTWVEDVKEWGIDGEMVEARGGMDALARGKVISGWGF